MKQSISALPVISLFAVTLVEFFNSAASSNITLTTCEERMTFRTYVNTKLRLNRTCRKSIAAAADYLCFLKIRMNTLFHLFAPHSFPKMGYKILNDFAI
jgi:hypothetical protein